MKDLDFDELDRAVNSLMTDTSKPSAGPKKMTDEQTLTITPTLSPDASPSFGTLDKTVAQLNTAPDSSVSARPVAAPSVATSVPRASPLASTRRGKFMDVVRPASAAKSGDAVRPVSRQAAPIEPSRSVMSDISPASRPDATPSVNQKDIDTPKSDWPDPIDMTGDKKTADISEEDFDKGLQAMAGDATGGYSPLTTPFLSDTKVEKRPLGNNQPVTDASAEAVSVEKDISDTSSQLPANPADVEHTQLPEELSGDMMAIEADTGAATDESEKPVMSRVDLEEPTPVKEVSTPEKAPEPKPVIPHTAVTLDPNEKLLPAGPISIPQQYHEEPSTGDKDNGSIYDTDTYHQPLAHPAKKKSGWMWVVWIALILAVGAGGGAALYFLGVF